ncbi:MAG: divalent-cation tolerance protein CutA [Actinobacteria bacterium]|nr:divalent-cation tolerance protein CutA [Actinomycetota bacterium]
MREEYIQVLTAFGNKPDAEKSAKILIEKRLAGCVQIIGPVSSTYRWKNEIEEEEEWLCIIKSKKSLYNELEKAIKEIHPYETPEIIAIPVVEGSREYLNWLANEIK